MGGDVWSFKTYLVGTADDLAVAPDGEFELPVGPPNPGLFTRNGVGRGLAAILNEHGTINTTENPAPKSSVVRFFGAGGPGRTARRRRTRHGRYRRHSPPAGWRHRRSRQLARADRVRRLGAELVAGLMQINVRVPENAAPGLVPVRVTIGGRFTRQPLFGAVE